LASKGWKLSPETRAKMSAIMTGKKHSAEHRANLTSSLNKPRPFIEFSWFEEFREIAVGLAHMHTKI